MTDPTEYERLVETAARVRAGNVSKSQWDANPEEHGFHIEAILAVFEAIGLTAESCIVPCVATQYMLNAVCEIGGPQWVANAQAIWPTMIAARPQLGDRSDG
jgi:hypothetical protein